MLVNLNILYLFTFSANEICKSKNKSKITVKDVLEAMEKSGFENFQPEIENLLMGNIISKLIFFIDIDKFTPTATKKRKNEEETTTEGGVREMPKNNSNIDD
jgi:hypothetical protein